MPYPDTIPLQPRRSSAENAMPPRIHAFLIHLAASATLALLTLALVYGLWYPPPLQKALGVTGIYLLLLGVDVVIGPTLTLVVFKPGKKSLYLDLAIIVCLQLTAFAYGLWTVADGRPAWLVFNTDRFDVAQAYQLDEHHSDAIPAHYRNPPWLGPRWVAAHMPTNAKAYDAALFKAIFSGVDIPLRPALYYPLAEAKDEIRKHLQPLDTLKRFNPAAAVDKAHARWPEADTFLPLMAKVRPMTVLMRKDTVQVVAIVDLNPWE